ncbi:MAG: hypothetical protein IT431_16675 [Phycisphaerales bacterium]|nr:hypothetical protein [Phycisphaerales bacterium]
MPLRTPAARLTVPLASMLTALITGALAAALPARAQPSSQAPSGATPAPAGPRAASDYDPRDIAGFACLISPDLVADPARLDRVLLHLGADLDEIAHLVPAPALAALRQTTIWVELQGAQNEGMSGRGLCCHWSEDWVVAHAMPAAKAGGVEIVNADDYLAWRTTQPYMLLHELAHAYHRMLGAETPEILSAYRHAIDAGLYDRLDRNSVALGEKVRAYAATNANEYFAEVSEAYLALNDFAPYTRAQLATLDPEGLAMAETLWNLPAAEIARRMTETGLVTPP